MGNVLKYNDYDVDAAQEELDDSETTGAAFMKLKAGANLVRVLPPTTGRSPFRVTYQHYLNMPGANGKAKSVICARLEAKQDCPVCRKVDELRQSKSKVDQDAANDLFARRRVFVNVIDRNDEEAGPKILAMGKTIHEALLALRTDTRGGGNYTHPEEGFDIIIDRKGSGKNDTEYKVRPDRNNSPLGPSVEVMQEWIDTQHNLNELARLPSEEKLAELLGGTEEEPSEEPRRLPPAQPRTNAGNRREAVADTRGARQQSSSPRRRTAEDDAIDVEGEEVQQ